MTTYYTRNGQSGTTSLTDFVTMIDADDKIEYVQTTDGLKYAEAISVEYELVGILGDLMAKVKI